MYQDIENKNFFVVYPINMIQNELVVLGHVFVDKRGCIQLILRFVQ